MPSLFADNLSTMTSFLTCIFLIFVTKRAVHYFVLLLVPITITRDTLVINYLIR